MSNDILYKIRNLYFKYNKNIILNDVNLDIYNEDFFVILGPNGSGKTTLIKNIVNVNKPTSGYILYNNKFINLPYKLNLKIKKFIYENKLKRLNNYNLNEKLNKYNNLLNTNINEIKRKNILNKIERIKNKYSLNTKEYLQKSINSFEFLIKNWSTYPHFHPKKASQEVSYVPQLSTFPEQTTVYDFVKLGRFPYSNIIGINTDVINDDIIIRKAIADVGMNEYIYSDLSELSGGQKQRALIALSLAQQTNTIVLDEPTNHLDIKAQLEILELLKKLHKETKKTIIMIIHDLNLGIKYANTLCFMKNGKIVKIGKAKEILSPSLINECFGIDVELHDDKLINISLHK